MKLFITYTFLFSLTILSAQQPITKQQEYENNKVQIFTVKERDNLQYWIQEELIKMDLTEEKEDEYKYILTSYIAKIGRLVDKDKDYNKDEIIRKMDKLIKKQNGRVKKLLSQEEYQMHLKTYDKLLLSAKNRISEMEF